MNVANVWNKETAKVPGKRTAKGQKGKSMAKWYGADDRNGCKGQTAIKRLQGCKEQKRATAKRCNRTLK